MFLIVAEGRIISVTLVCLVFQNYFYVTHFLSLLGLLTITYRKIYKFTYWNFPLILLAIYI